MELAGYSFSVEIAGDPDSRLVNFVPASDSAWLRRLWENAATNDTILFVVHPDMRQAQA